MSTNAQKIRVNTNERGLAAELTALILDVDRGSAENDWRHESACAGRMDDLMWPAAEPGTKARARQAAPAKQLCATCPVKAECLAWAFEREPWGVWGGLDEDERANLRRQAGRAPLADLLEEQDQEAA